MKLKKLVASICILSMLLMSNVVLANETYIPMMESTNSNGITPRMDITTRPVIENGQIGYFINQSTGKPFTFLQGSAVHISLGFDGPTNCRYGIATKDNKVYKNIEPNELDSLGSAMGLKTIFTNRYKPSNFSPWDHGYIVSPANCVGESLDNCKFAIPETGEYKIFIQNLGSDPISIKSFSIGNTILEKVPGFVVVEERTAFWPESPDDIPGGVSFGYVIAPMSEIQNGEIKIYNSSTKTVGYISIRDLIERQYR